MKKKLLPVLLALALCLGLLPVASLAADVSCAVTGGNIYFDAGTGTVTGCDKTITAANIPAEIMGVPVKTIGNQAFQGCEQLTSVTIPQGVTSIGNHAFLRARALTQVSIPNTVTSIGIAAFQECSSLTSITLPASLTTLEQNAFEKCKSLSQIVIPNGVKEIPFGCFWDCASLSSVTIPDSVTSIRGYAFAGCSKLKGILIPGSVTEIELGAFADSGLESISLPNSVKKLEMEVFQSCTALKSVTLPNQITVIGTQTFENCKSLETVSIPASVTSINSSAFEGCDSLSDVYFGGDLAQWSAVEVGGYNSALSSATVHFNSSFVASNWAKPEMEKAQNMGLIPDVLQGQDLTKPITRAEFAAVSVRVFENLTGTHALPAVTNPFTDTADLEVLKAYNTGITVGTSASTFTPGARLNREQCATMLTRVFKRCTMPGWTMATDGQFKLSYAMPAKFADDRDISSWARDSVYFMAANKIISGVGNNTFAPRNTTSAQEAQGYANATREQALAIAVRMVENLG